MPPYGPKQHPLGDPNAPYASYTLLAPEYLHSLPAYPYTPNTHTPLTPNGSQYPLYPRVPQCPLILPIPLLVVNCCHFATDHLHAVRMLIFYRCHFQLFLLCHCPSSQVCPVHKIPSLGVKNTSSVLWSSANLYSISENMHYKDSVASQHWKTNKVVWTWKDDWPHGELLHTKDLLPKRVTM